MTENDATLIPLAEVQPAMVEQLLDRAFGAERTKRTAYKVREGMDYLPALSFAALDAQEMVVGSIQVWPIGLTDREGRQHPMLMVGPVAVVPERQSEGFGQALMLAMLGALDGFAKQGQPPLPQVLIGDADYYGRFFGFTADHTPGWTLPGPWERDRLLVRCDEPAILPSEGALGPWRG